jgi:hypothetical protein
VSGPRNTFGQLFHGTAPDQETRPLEVAEQVVLMQVLPIGVADAHQLLPQAYSFDQTTQAAVADHDSGLLHISLDGGAEAEMTTRCGYIRSMPNLRNDLLTQNGLERVHFAYQGIELGAANRYENH